MGAIIGTDETGIVTKGASLAVVGIDQPAKDAIGCIPAQFAGFIGKLLGPVLRSGHPTLLSALTRANTQWIRRAATHEPAHRLPLAKWCVANSKDSASRLPPQAIANKARKMKAL
jgi:hypothetical protein